MIVPHPIPYQGSKRNLAYIILSFFPDDTGSLVEPFAGSAAISLAAAAHRKATHFQLNDINEPLIDLWDAIINRPEGIFHAYRKLWLQQKGNERKFYDSIRDQFNKNPRPDLMLYLLARCVKGSIRYNSIGGFNQSPDNRRKGRNPENMRRDIFGASNLFKAKVILTHRDYKQVFDHVSNTDLVYMDPPYQGLSGRHSRYSNKVDFDDFVSALRTLVKRDISFILSYDGKTGNKTHGNGLPSDLRLHHTLVKVGRSAQSTLLGRRDITYESIYLSDVLANRLAASRRVTVQQLAPHIQLALALDHEKAPA